MKLREDVEKLIKALIKIPKDQRTKAMNRLLLNLIDAADQYDEATKESEPHERTR